MQYNKAIQALTSSHLAQTSPEVYAEMLTKHPQKVPPTAPSSLVPTPLKISKQKFIEALRNFSNGTVPGYSRLPIINRQYSALPLIGLMPYSAHFAV